MACIDCGEVATSLDELGYCDACNASWEEYEAAKDEWEQSYYDYTCGDGGCGCSNPYCQV